MMIQAVLGNPHHPEYGVATIPFPIPRDQHAHCMELLEALEIGDAVKADCKVEEIDSFYTVLKRAEMLTVNVEELNYLAKRLDSFDTGEAAQFQAMAHKLELFELKDLINLTFCCQQATVITDFSDLDAVGRDHYMNLHGGSASVDELNKLDGKGTARQLIESGSGTITPYGVVYDNGMKLKRYLASIWQSWTHPIVRPTQGWNCPLPRGNCTMQWTRCSFRRTRSCIWKLTITMASSISLLT